MAGEASHGPLLFGGGRKWALISGMSLFLLAAVCLTYIVSSAEPAEQRRQTEGEWQIETVDDSGGWINGSSIVADSDDNPHISYHLDDLKYSYKDGSVWDNRVLNDHGVEPSLAIDDMGYAHICYRNATSMDYTYQTTTGWSWEWVYRYVSDNSFCSIALDRDNYVRFSFYDYNIGASGSLVYAYQDANSWKFKYPDQVTDLSGLYSSLALDKNDYPHISYYTSTDDYDLKYAFQDAQGWHVTTVDRDNLVGAHTSLALDSNGYPHISYFYCGTQTFPTCNAYDLKYAYMDASRWYTETVDSVGQVGTSTSIAVDKNGYAHISYRDTGNEDLKYAYQDSSGWNIETVDSQGDVGIYTSLALGKYGSVHISYFDKGNEKLKYAYKEGTEPPELLVFVPLAVAAGP